jgi:prepilin-type N-terminal cleavage/methylation domain-containing protein
MRFTSGRGRKGFSLVELVIVIVIIGIIAAIAIPRVSRGSKSAGESSLASNLSVLRNAVELYASEHNGLYPAAAADGSNAVGSTTALINQLTKFSNESGKTADAKDTTQNIVLGPYLRKGIPPLPVGTNHGKATIKMDSTNSPPLVAVSSGEGWVYNYKTGDIIANADDNNEANDKTYDQY